LTVIVAVCVRCYSQDTFFRLFCGTLSA